MKESTVQYWTYLTSLSICANTSLSLKKEPHWESGLGFRGWSSTWLLPLPFLLSLAGSTTISSVRSTSAHYLSLHQPSRVPSRKGINLYHLISLRFCSTRYFVYRNKCKWSIMISVIEVYECYSDLFCKLWKLCKREILPTVIIITIEN